MATHTQPTLSIHKNTPTAPHTHRERERDTHTHTHNSKTQTSKAQPQHRCLLCVRGTEKSECLRGHQSQTATPPPPNEGFEVYCRCETPPDRCRKNRRECVRLCVCVCACVRERGREKVSVDTQRGTGHRTQQSQGFLTEGHTLTHTHTSPSQDTFGNR